MALHASGEDYLEAILVLHKKMGMVRSVDVARHMEVSKPSVCHAVATLRDGGFLTMDSDYFLHLTDVGREVAEQIYEKHRFFTERLIAAGVDPETAERDACRIEHVISEESFRRLKAVTELSFCVKGDKHPMEEIIKLKYQIIPTGRGGNLLCWSFFENRVVKLSRRRPRCMHANNNNLVQAEQSRLNGADNQTLNR